MKISIWLVLLYGAFAVLAIRSLLTLMQRHHKVHLYVLKRQAKIEADKKAARQAEEENAQQEVDQAA